MVALVVVMHGKIARVRTVHQIGVGVGSQRTVVNVNASPRFLDAIEIIVFPMLVIAKHLATQAEGELSD